jgi:four helix bundle protein
MQTDNDNMIVKLTFDSAIQIVEFTSLLEAVKKWSIANQLLRSGTSIGANMRKAQNAESKSEFIHKMKLAAKEADETEYWLLLCQHVPNLPDPKDLLTSLLTIHKVLSMITGTSKGELASSI